MMAKQRPDFSFEREARSLEVWLQQLVSEDAPTRRAAGEALQAMMYGVPSVHTDWADIDWPSSDAISNQSGRFRDALRGALNSREADARDFVRKLILYRTALKEDWNRRVKKTHAKLTSPGPYESRLLKRIEAAEDDDARAKAARRYMRWICASLGRSLERDNDDYAHAESMSAAGLMAGIVFDSLDACLLADRPGLYAMLADKGMRADASAALARIGPPAIEFAPIFFEELDSQEPKGGYFEGAVALGSIGRDDPGVIDGLLGRLRSGTIAVRAGAATALFHAGPPLAGRLDIAIDLLVGATYTSELAWSAIPALASVGRDSEPAFRRVLELAKPRPARWREDESYPDHRYDEVMVERAAAIDSLWFFKPFADEIVPVLVDALDTFEEFDADWYYHGEHGRVCAALEKFGPLAAPAVSRLTRYLEEWSTRPEQDRDWPKGIFGLLAAIGPPAVGALPTLEHIRSMVTDDESSSTELDPDDPLDRTIIALQKA